MSWSNQLVATAQETPLAALQSIWQRADQLGSYRYHTTIHQETAPLPTLANVGLGPEEKQLYLEGTIDKTTERMAMKLWADDGDIVMARGALEIEVDNGQARGRLDGGQWETVEDITNLFAPGQDPLAFLRAAQVVSAPEPTTITLPNGSQQALQHYRFELDGPTLAGQLKSHMEATLRQQGKLPNNVNLTLPPTFLHMTGSGELWVDAQGLPWRQKIALTFPPEAQSQINAAIVTDFSQWGESRMLFADWGGPLSRMANAGGWTVHALQQQVTAASWLLLALAATFLVIRHRRHRYLYGTLVYLLIASMIGLPLLQAQRVDAFYSDQADQQSAQQADQELQQRYADQQAALFGNSWDPQRNPLATQDEPQAVVTVKGNAAPAAAPLLQAQSTPPPSPIDGLVDDGTDSDGDGLTDAVEIAYNLKVNNVDSDGDGLSDGIEVYELGTDPARADTDSDGLSDGAEVKGFSLGGTSWYFDPTSGDSSGDGLPDGYACTENNGTLSCTDTDGDNQPDVYDFDDDNDGVPDSADSAPARFVGDLQNGLTDQSFTYTLNQLATNKPVFVDFQLRPTNPDHLWYSLSILDWPAGDKLGQVQRVHNTTFYDELSATEQADLSAASSLHNGDLRLIPMLEINIPFDGGVKGGNLPLLPNAPATISASTPITTWLDVDAMQSFGISVRRLDEAGNLLAYVPLTLVREEAENGPVAFGGRMLYQPNSATFGPGHTMRLVWVVEAITDSLPPIPADFATDKDEDERYDLWRNDNSHWISNGANLIHVYADDWLLTGLEVTENLGMSTATVYTDPARVTPTPNTIYEEELWQLTRGLDQSLMTGRDVDNNGRDVTVATVGSWFAEANGGCAPFAGAHPWQWDLNSSALRARCNSYDSVIGMGDLAANQIPAILQERYTPQVNGGQQDALILALREEQFRHLPLDQATLTGVTPSKGGIAANALTLALDPATVKPAITAAMNWLPYRWNGVDGWETYPIEQYAIDHADRWETLLSTTWSDPEDAEAAALFVTGYYFTQVSGQAQIVVYNNVAAKLEASLSDTGLQALKNGAILDNVVNGIMNAIYSWTVGTDLKDIGSLLNYGNSINTSYAEAFQRVFDLDSGFVKQLQLEGVTNELTPGTFMKLMSVVGNDVTKTALMKQIGRSLIASAGLGVVASVSGSIAAIASMGAAIAETLGATISRGWQLAISSIGLVSALFTVASLAAGVFAAVKSGVTMAGQALKFLSADIVFFVASTLISIGFFIYNAVVSDIDPTSLAFGAALAGLIASIVVGVIFLAIAAIPIVGQLIVAIVFLIDAIISIICQAIGIYEKTDDELNNGGEFARDYVCPGISGILAQLIQYLFYSQTTLVDLANENRLNLTNFDLQPVDLQRGFIAGNTVTIALDVDTALYKNAKPKSAFAAWYDTHFTDEHLKESTFVYAVQDTEIDIDENLELGTMSNQWQVPGADSWAADSNFVHRTPVQANVTLDRSGINRLDTIYLSEGYIINAQECGTTVPFIPICWLKDEHGTLHMNLGEGLAYDVFPGDLTAFRALEPRGNGSYGLNWGGGTTFPTLMDADGDGLRSTAVGGNDPDDSDPDTDDDGLSDFYERYLGFDPMQTDSDGDNLDDAEELRLGTNPLRADTDGDGLRDDEEIAGWTFVYGFDGTTPLRTHVRSNPLVANADGDAYLDSVERTYGYNPNVPSYGDPLSITGEVAPADQVVRPGETIHYTATVADNLRTSYAQGRLDVDFPAAANSSDLAPKAFELAPGQAEQLAGTVTVNQVATSQMISLTNIAGAQIINAYTEAGGRALWLDFSENNAPYSDQSFLNHIATCAPACPTHLTSEYRGGGVRFGVDTGLQVDATPATLGIDEDGFTFAAYLKSSGSFFPLMSFTVFSTASLYRLQLNGDKLQINYRNSTTTLATLPAPTSWTHLALRVEPNGNTYRHTVFVDGQQLGAVDVNLPYTDLTFGTVNFGDHDNAQSAGGTLSVDEVQLYQLPLSDEEIANLSNDLVAYLDGRSVQGTATGNDASPYRNTFRCADDGNGTICPSPDSGPGGQAYRVGSNEDQSMYEVVGGPQLDLSKRDGRFSISTFVRVYEGGWLTGNGEPGSGTQPFPALRAQQDNIQLKFGAGATSCDLQVSFPVNGSGGSVLSEGWHHIAATFDGDLAKLYLDTEQVAQKSCPNAHADAIQTFYAGGLNRFDASGPLGQNYNGLFDDLRIYNFALTPDNLRTLVNLGLPTLDLHFDEPPARESFADASQNRLTTNCNKATDSCPFSGLPGRINQAVQFDGVNDLVTLPSPNSLGIAGSSFSVAAWVKSDIVNNAPIVAADSGLLMALTNIAGTLRPAFAMSGVAGITGAAIQPNRWYHLVWRYTYDPTNSNNSKIELFVDGVKQANTQSQVSPLAASNSALQLGKLGSNRFQGMVDALQVYSLALTDDQISALYQRAPVLNLHLEAPQGDQAVTNDAVPWLDGECSGVQCPATGIKGKVYRGFAFDGVNDLVTVPNTLDSVAQKKFSVGLWFKPTSSKADWQTLVVRERADFQIRNYGLFIAPNTMDLHYSIHTCTNLGQPTGTIDGTVGPLFENRWNHALLTYDGKEVVIYINGYRAESKSGNNICTTAGDFLLGASIGGTRAFAGELDEVVLYPVALGAGEVADIYRYGQNWFDTDVATPIVIDAVNPTVNFVIGASILAQRTVLMAGTALDDLSGVSEFDYRVRIAGQPWGNWQSATADGNSWIFPFAPTQSGQYEIGVRATDAAGNSSTVSDSVQVDGVGPVLGAFNVEALALVPVERDLSNNNWSVALDGAVTAEGSPLASVMVQLTAPDGTPVTDPLPATVNNGRWQLHYPFALRPNGTYVVTVRATDQVGNASVRTANVKIDGTPPQGQIGTSALGIKSNSVLTGTASETGAIQSGVASVAVGFAATAWDEQSPAHWLTDGLLLHLPLDENSIATAARAAEVNAAAIDAHAHIAVGQAATAASCSGASCPGDGIRGMVANSVRFDGVDDGLQALLTNTGTVDSFSLGGWVQPTASGSDQPIIALTKDGNPLWSLRYNGDSERAVIGWGNQRTEGTVAVAKDSWHHLALTVINGSNASLYIDGVVAATFTATTATPIIVGTIVQLGVEGAAHYTGGLDDVLLYNRALTNTEVARIVRGYGAVLHLPFDGYSFQDGELLPETSRYQQAASLHLSSRDTLFTNAGFVGTGAIALNNDEFITMASDAHFDLSAGEFTQMAWVLLPATANAGPYPIIGGDQSNAAQSYPSLSITADGRVTVSFGNGSTLLSYTTQPLIGKDTPTAVAATFDGAVYRIYINGALAESTDSFAGHRPTATTVFDIGRQLGATERYYTGGLDEIAIYRQTLSAQDVAALYAQGWQYATLSNPGANSTTWSYPVPAALDGGYTIQLMTADGQGNVTFGGQGNDQWQGTISPRGAAATVDPNGDDDNDGVRNGVEDLNGNGDPTDDDSDGDGIPNFLDVDDDNDTFPTQQEGSTTDTDRDGTPNYLDSDDDGDGVPTVQELGDTNGNGIPDYLESATPVNNGLRLYLPLIRH